MREPDLAHGRRGLTLIEPQGSLREPEMAPAERDRARGDENHLLAALAQAQQILAETLEPGAIEAAIFLVDEQSRADFDDHPACPCERRCDGGVVRWHGKTIRNRYLCCDLTPPFQRAVAPPGRRTQLGRPHPLFGRSQGGRLVAPADSSPYTCKRRWRGPKGKQAVSREYEPVPGQWYENLEEEEPFRVLTMDEDSELVEIEYLDGDIEEIDLETWHEMDLERIQEPEGWSESDDEDETEEDEEDWEEDEDEDDDDLDEDDDDVDEERDEY